MNRYAIFLLSMICLLASGCMQSESSKADADLLVYARKVAVDCFDSSYALLASDLLFGQSAEQHGGEVIWNQWIHRSDFPTPPLRERWADMDRLISMAYLNLRGGAICVVVPQETDRRFAIQGFDHHGNSLGYMTDLDAAGKVLLLTHASDKSSYPDSAYCVIKYPSWAGFARLTIPASYDPESTADLAVAQAMQAGFVLDPHESSSTSSSYATQRVLPYPSGVTSVAEHLLRMDCWQHLDDLLSVMQSDSTTYPDATKIYNRLFNLRKSDLDASILEQIDHEIELGYDEVNAKLQDDIADNPFIDYKNGWSYYKDISDFTTPYYRSFLMMTSPMPDEAQELMTFYVTKDKDELSLDGSLGSYTMLYTLDELPDVLGYWSLGVYDNEGYLIPNDYQRYNLNSQRNNLHFNRDEGSLTLYLSPTPPIEPEHYANWLPIPRAPFQLVMRVAQPTADYLSMGVMVKPFVVRR